MADFAPYDPDTQLSGELVSAVVREVSSDDLDALATIELAAGTRNRDDWASVIDKALADEDRLLLVAHVAGEIAAFAQTHFLPEHPEDRAPAGFYLTGVRVVPAFRRAGLGHQLTISRLDWIRERDNKAWYFANAENRASIDLHLGFGFAEVRRAPSLHGVAFDAGEGILFRAELDGGVSREEDLARP